ncbi:hypothetical protein [Nocardioides sp.]|uniref:hypothetical protein n=1 Tax=Nocardioides sp. TaxID=35761 RepID=UPI002733356F|nr:hypothetical protein [Nocardioides sp.]MDP3889674.1 hypothetical protein [Nocardioides sp.]
MEASLLAVVLVVVLIGLVLALLVTIGVVVSSRASRRRPPAGPMTDEVRAEISAHIVAGKKIHAIKVLRDHSQLGLADAKAQVERWAATGELERVDPADPAAWPAVSAAAADPAPVEMARAAQAPAPPAEVDASSTGPTPDSLTPTHLASPRPPEQRAGPPMEQLAIEARAILKTSGWHTAEAYLRDEHGLGGVEARALLDSLDA